MKRTFHILLIALATFVGGLTLNAYNPAATALMASSSYNEI